MILLTQQKLNHSILNYLSQQDEVPACFYYNNVFVSKWSKIWSDKKVYQTRWKIHSEQKGVNKTLAAHSICTNLPAKSDSDVVFCLQSYQGLRSINSCMLK